MSVDRRKTDFFNFAKVKETQLAAPSNSRPRRATSMCLFILYKQIRNDIMRNNNNC